MVSEHIYFLSIVLYSVLENFIVYSLFVRYLESSMRINITANNISESKYEMYFPRKYRSIKLFLANHLIVVWRHMIYSATNNIMSCLLRNIEVNKIIHTFHFLLYLIISLGMKYFMAHLEKFYSKNFEIRLPFLYNSFKKTNTKVISSLNSQSQDHIWL